MMIRKAHCIDPATNLDAPRDVLLENGLIAALELPGTLPSHPDELDATGMTLTPGFLDIHVHLREPGQTHKETIATGTAAAAAGGFTTVVAMPNTAPVNDSVETLTWMQAAERHPVTRLLAMPAATLGSKGQRLTDFAALAQAGAVGFTDDGHPILEDAIMRAALVAAARLNLAVSQHAEDTRISPSSGINAGPLAFRLGLRGMSIEAESSIVERDLRLLREIEQTEKLRPHLHVQHVSTAKALAAIRQAKAQGLHVTCEVAPHHFTLTEDAIADFNTNCKMNPPLRHEQDRQAVLEAIADGTIDCIATDHAPHARHEKEVEFERAPNGITGLETALGLALNVLKQIPLPRIIALLTTNPAAIIRRPELGTLAPGTPADLTLFNPTVTWPYRAQQSLSKSRNSPFEGTELQGRIHQTILAGKAIYKTISTV